MKDKYITYAKKTFNRKALKIVLNQIELYYDKTSEIAYSKYQKNDDVYLKKGTFLHGIPGELDNFNWTIENGFISNNFTNISKTRNKIKNSIGMWNIKEDIYLKDYINIYSGFTISYSIKVGSDSKFISKLIPYHQFDEITEQINNQEEIRKYWGEQTKEVRFLPSLVSNKRQIAFILNMESDYAKKISKADIWTSDLDKKTLKQFLDYQYYDKFFAEKLNRNALTTDRESEIIFGLPIKLVEGILVGRQLEKNTEIINYIKSKLPHCYICNLDGKVIIGNK